MAWVRNSDPKYGSFPYAFDVYREDGGLGNTALPALIMFLKYGFDKEVRPCDLPPNSFRRIAYGLKEPGTPDLDPLKEIHKLVRRMFPKTSLNFKEVPKFLPKLISECYWQLPGVVSVAFPGATKPHLAVCLGPQSQLEFCNYEIIFLDPIYGVVVTPFVVPRGPRGRVRPMPYDTTHNSFGGRGRQGTIRAGVFSMRNPNTGQE